MSDCEKSVKNELFDEFVDLTVKRDRLKKERELIWIAYVRKFGDLIEEEFRLTIEAIKARKTIAYCQRAKYFGVPVVRAEMEYDLERELADYYEELNCLREAKDRKGVPVSDYEYFSIKKTYKKIAKLIHPDIYPEAFRIEGVKEQWEKAKNAYDCNDLNALKEAEAVVADLLEKHTGKTIAVEIPDIAQKITDLGNEINEIVTNDPYRYKYLLADEGLTEEKRQSLRESIEESRKYLGELQEMIGEFEITEVIN